MKKLLSLIVLTGAFTMAMAQTTAPAAAPAKPMAAAATTDAPAAQAAVGSGQQNRMKTCNADEKAKTLKGDGRKAFMKSCLKGEAETAQAPATTQQSKMKTCNMDASAKALKGDERKQFMSSCLKG